LVSRLGFAGEGAEGALAYDGVKSPVIKGQALTVSFFKMNQML
jgi:hypothetical protein